MKDWSKWNVNPPPSAVAELERLKDSDVDPFSVVAVDLNRETQRLTHTHGPFLMRAFREAKPSASVDDAMFATLQPMITAVFGEWIAAQPVASTGVVDMAKSLKEFAQFAVDCVNALAMQRERHANRGKVN